MRIGQEFIRQQNQQVCSLLLSNYKHQMQQDTNNTIHNKQATKETSLSKDDITQSISSPPKQTYIGNRPNQTSQNQLPSQNYTHSNNQPPYSPNKHSTSESYGQQQHPYQYQNCQQPQWGFNQFGYPYGFPNHFGYGHGRGHGHGHRGHGYHGHRGGYHNWNWRGYHQQGENSQGYSNQFQQFNGYPPHQPPVVPPQQQPQQMCAPPEPSYPFGAPPFAFPPTFGRPPPPPGFSRPPPPPMAFGCPPPFGFTPPIPPHYRPPFVPSNETGESMMPKYPCGGKKWRGGKHKGRKNHRDSSSRSFSRSKSSSSSQSSDNNDAKYQRKNLKKAESIKYDEEITKFYQKEMNDFMQSRQVKEKQREKIITVLKKSYPAYDAPIFQLCQFLQIIQKQNLTFRMSYVKIIKVLLKCQFDLSEAIPRLQKIQHHKLKKYQADQQFNENYGDLEQTPLLEVNDLILMHSNEQKVLYLVDGNNILPTNKHFRKYFQSKSQIEKVIAQIRARWYISHAFEREEVILFFDERFEDRDYDFASKSIFLSKAEEEKSLSIEVIYGNGQKADEKIIQKLKELSAMQDEKVEIILVSADRDLNMRCQAIKPILHTSGRFFFKYCKYSINRKYKQDKKMKHLAKGIAVYDESKE